MSHNSLKRGKSFYVNNLNPEANKYINTCVICGCKGYSPALDEADFSDSGLFNSAILKEVKKICKDSLQLDEYGRCKDCSERINKS